MVFIQETHQHEWHRTGERHPTTSPIWFYHCTCGAVGKAVEGDEVTVWGNDPLAANRCLECQREARAATGRG